MSLDAFDIWPSFRTYLYASIRATPSTRGRRTRATASRSVWTTVIDSMAMCCSEVPAGATARRTCTCTRRRRLALSFKSPDTMETTDLRARLRAANDTLLLCTPTAWKRRRRGYRSWLRRRGTFRPASLAIRVDLYSAEVHVDPMEEVVRLTAAHARYEGLVS